MIGNAGDLLGKSPGRGSNILVTDEYNALFRTAGPYNKRLRDVFRGAFFFSRIHAPDDVRQDGL